MSGEGEQGSQQASPWGNILKIADAVKRQIKANPETAELPSLAEVGTTTSRVVSHYERSRAVPIRGRVTWRASHLVR